MNEYLLYKNPKLPLEAKLAINTMVTAYTKANTEGYLYWYAQLELLQRLSLKLTQIIPDRSKESTWKHALHHADAFLQKQPVEITAPSDHFAESWHFFLRTYFDYYQQLINSPFENKTDAVNNLISVYESLRQILPYYSPSSEQDEQTLLNTKKQQTLQEALPITTPELVPLYEFVQQELLSPGKWWDSNNRSVLMNEVLDLLEKMVNILRVLTKSDRHWVVWGLSVDIYSADSSNNEQTDLDKIKQIYQDKMERAIELCQKSVANSEVQLLMVTLSSLKHLKSLLTK